jgi:hypothetical protein
MALPEHLIKATDAVKEAAHALTAWGQAMAAATRAEEKHKEALAEITALEDAQENYMAARNIEATTLGRGHSAFTAHREVAAALLQKKYTEDAAAEARLKAEKALKKMSDCVALSP